MRFFEHGDPLGCSPVVDVIGPNSGNQEIDVETEFYGKSESDSRTVSVVSGARPPIDEKIIAPVCLQRTRRGSSGPGSTTIARRRRYSETLTPSFLAWARIRRASSSVTLNVIVVIVGNTVLPQKPAVNRGSGSRLNQSSNTTFNHDLPLLEGNSSLDSCVVR